MEDFKSYCQDYILEKLRNRIGDELWLGPDSLVDMITSYDLDNGTITMSEPKAMEYINEWQLDAGEFLDHMQYHFGKVLCNPFKRPGLFMVYMVREGCAILLKHCPIMEKYGNAIKIISRQFVRQLEKELDEIREVDW